MKRLLNTAFAALLAAAILFSFCAAAAATGDFDGDGNVTSDDAEFLLRHTLFPGFYRISGYADYDHDGTVTSDDAVYLLRHTLFPESYSLAAEGPAPTPSEPVSSEPEISEPEPSKPESSEPEPSEPDISGPETSEPVSSEPEPAEPAPELPYPTYKGITKSKIKSSELDSYFDDSMFIGLSVFVHFSVFTKTMRTVYPDFLGSSIIFARSNFSAYNNFRYKPTDEDSVHPLYKGEKMTCEDAVKASGVKRVYLSIMALNELGIYGSNCVERTFESTVRLINAIKAKSPSVEIVIMSNTYMVYDYNNFKNLNNGNISALNNMVLDYCNTHGMDFIDVSTMLMDGNVLADKYCRDAHSGSGCHLNNDGFAIWTAVLRNYAFLKEKGLYKNPASMPTYTKNK